MRREGRRELDVYQRLNVKGFFDLAKKMMQSFLPFEEDDLDKKHPCPEAGCTRSYNSRKSLGRHTLKEHLHKLPFYRTSERKPNKVSVKEHRARKANNKQSTIIPLIQLPITDRITTLFHHGDESREEFYFALYETDPISSPIVKDNNAEDFCDLCNQWNHCYDPLRAEIGAIRAYRQGTDCMSFTLMQLVSLQGNGHAHGNGYREFRASWKESDHQKLETL
jgi:hypothetical protein